MTGTAEFPGFIELEEISKRHHHRIALLKETLQRQGYLMAVSQRDSGYSILLSRNLSGPGWRITSFRDREPIGHREYEVLDGRAPAFNALQEFGGSDWKLIERTPAAIPEIVTPEMTGREATDQPIPYRSVPLAIRRAVRKFFAPD